MTQRDTPCSMDGDFLLIIMEKVQVWKKIEKLFLFLNFRPEIKIPEIETWTQSLLSFKITWPWLLPSEAVWIVKEMWNNYQYFTILEDYFNKWLVAKNQVNQPYTNKDVKY